MISEITRRTSFTNLIKNDFSLHLQLFLKNCGIVENAYSQVTCLPHSTYNILLPMPYNMNLQNNIRCSKIYVSSYKKSANREQSVILKYINC